MESEFAISQSEKNSILFYQGSVDKIKLNAFQDHLNDFYSVSNAYEVMNVILFPGIKNEVARIVREKRKLEPILAQHISELLSIYCEIYSAMCKYTFYSKRSRYYTYRKDRIASLRFLRQGKINSFFSTSLNDNIDESFHMKSGILLLEVEASGSIEHLDINAVLGEDSVYSKEEEILFAPFLYLDMERLELTSAERRFCDFDGKSPKGKYKIILKGSLIDCCNKWAYEQDARMADKLKEEIQKPEYVNNAMRIWSDLESGKFPDKAALQMYFKWKEDIQRYLKLQFTRIKKYILDKRNLHDDQISEDKRLSMLKDEIHKYILYSNARREKYDTKLTCFNAAISILQPIGTLAIALSLINGCESFEMTAKISSLVCNAICLILMGIIKSFALEDKVRQRTTTYLKLDELQRDLRYETDISIINIGKYIERFKHIVMEDNSQCRENVESSIAYTELLIAESVDKK